MLSRKLLSILFLTGIVVILVITCSKDNPVDSVSFKTPGTYKGIYLHYDNYGVLNEDPVGDTDKVIFEFLGNGKYTMDIDPTEPDTHFCIVNEGTFNFTGDSLHLTVEIQNQVPRICATGRSPESSYLYSIQGNYLAFDFLDMDNHVVKKIELIGN